METLLNISKRLIQIGNKLHLHLGEDPEGVLDKKIQDALKRGETVTEAGVSQWIEFFEVIDPSKLGSAIYTWKGDKVKAEKFLVTKDKTGGVVKQSLGFTWRTL